MTPEIILREGCGYELYNARSLGENVIFIRRHNGTLHMRSGKRGSAPAWDDLPPCEYVLHLLYRPTVLRTSSDVQGIEVSPKDPGFALRFIPPEEEKKEAP